MSHCWNRACCKFPGTYKLNICSIDGFRCLVVGLEAPCAFCRLNLCLAWLRWYCLAAVFQVCLICWKQGFHFLWKFFAWRSADKLVNCFMSHCWCWGKYPSSYEVCVCSIDGFRCLVVGLKAPCAFRCLHFCLTWLRWRCLATVFQVCLVCWK